MALERVVVPPVVFTVTAVVPVVPPLLMMPLRVVPPEPEPVTDKVNGVTFAVFVMLPLMVVKLEELFAQFWSAVS